MASLSTYTICLMSPEKARATNVGSSEKMKSMEFSVCSGMPLGAVFIGWFWGVSELAWPVVSP